ncbi:hypothetical protein [Clostridium senegalense]|uniref:DUF5316 domain-containing protein n=1 Tax=Clostridium senegalense TaxID=1465809 RepID=A0A6M0H1B9_9CLOT|nr:hypothetical protein [Clostridium senegalense]NEU03681.1 hypothetical protein [Clostridium senegalense]
MIFLSMVSLITAIILLVFIESPSIILAFSLIFISFISSLSNLKKLSNNTEGALKNKEFKIISNKSISICSAILIMNVFIVSSLILIFFLQKIT